MPGSPAVAVPAMNVNAFTAGMRGDPLDTFSYDMNRIYPGRPDGFPTERIAHAHSIAMVETADLEMTILVPSAAAAQARAAIEAVLPISDGWEPSALGRQPVSAIVQRRLRSPESSWRGLGDDPAEITVVVVRTP